MVVSPEKQVVQVCFPLYVRINFLWAITVKPIARYNELLIYIFPPELSTTDYRSDKHSIVMLKLLTTPNLDHVHYTRAFPGTFPRISVVY